MALMSSGLHAIVMLQFVTSEMASFLSSTPGTEKTDHLNQNGLEWCTWPLLRMIQQIITYGETYKKTEKCISHY